MARYKKTLWWNDVNKLKSEIEDRWLLKTVMLMLWKVVYIMEENKYTNWDE